MVDLSKKKVRVEVGCPTTNRRGGRVPGSYFYDLVSDWLPTTIRTINGTERAHEGSYPVTPQFQAIDKQQPGSNKQKQE
ncbi:hypothetical protein VTI74DRAFT_10686 [Chaetomium olivicolor]